MTELDAINLEIENFKKQMAVLFILADQKTKDELLDELNQLLKRRDKLLSQSD